MGVIVESVALIAAVPAALYALGLAALWVQISTTYTQDFAVAWYAASLVPNTMVLGQGIHVFWEELLWLIVLALVTYTPVRRSFSHRPGTPAMSSRAKKTMIGILIAILFTMYLLITFVELPEDPVGTFPLFRVASFACGTASALLAALVLVWNAERGTPLHTRILVMLAILYMGAFGIGIFDSALDEPPLPSVTLNAAGTDNIEGQLLVHAEGYWHILTREGSVVSVPDNEARLVKASSNP